MSTGDGRGALTAPSRWFGPSEGVPVLIGSLLVSALCIWFFSFASHSDADTWVPILVAVNMAVIGYLVCRWLSGWSMSRRDPRLFRIVMLGFCLKMLCTGPRYYLNEGFYKGETDAFNYNKAGVLFVSNVKQGNWSIDGSEISRFPRETRVLGYIVGCLYIVFGTSYFGAYLIFALVSWLGVACFFRAFQVSFPNAPPYLAAKLLFFLPSIMFWPSSPGKEGIMVFLIGLFTLGVARMMAKSSSLLGFVEMLFAGVLILQVRPHMLLISVAAIGASLLSVPEKDDRLTSKEARRGALFRLLLLVLLVPALVSGLGRLDTIFKTKDGGSSSIDDSLNATIARTEIGGSAFKTRPVRSPQDVPAALVTVLYRPFAFEARNAPSLIAALEGSLLLVLTLLSSRWIWRVFPAMYRNQFAAYCGGYVLGFVVAFSNIGNAGILSRQRTQMFPLLLLLACIAKEHERTHTAPVPTEELVLTGYQPAGALPDRTDHLV